MIISVVLCKNNEEINYVSIFHNHGSGFDCAIDQQNYSEIVTKIRSYKCYAWNI